MAFLAAAAAPRTPFALASSSRRRYVLPAAVKATAGSNTPAPNPVVSSLRLAASATVLLAATRPAIACTPSPPPPPPALIVNVSPDDTITDDSHPFEKLIIETAALARCGGAEAAWARLSAASVGGEHYARLLAAQALFVDGKLDDAIAAFEEIAREDPNDYRPLFCQGVLYFVLGSAAESDSMLQRCRKIAGDEFGADFLMPVSLVDAEATEAEPRAEAEQEKL